MIFRYLGKVGHCNLKKGQEYNFRWGHLKTTVLFSGEREMMETVLDPLKVETIIKEIKARSK